MLTKLAIRNFKRFDDVEIPLGNPVVFIGPNNSGKTTALQALALWELGLRRWKEKRSERSTPEKRPGVAINRRDLLSVPMPSANLLWRGLRTRNVQKENGKQQTQNIRIDVLVEGNTTGADWRCGLEFDFANEESFFCRPLRLTEGKSPERMPVPEQAYGVRVAFLPPMSGLAANETRLDSGAVNVRLGEGRTAEVLRNLCYSLATSEEDSSRWDAVVRQTRDLFQVDLGQPEYVPERGEVQMSYRDHSGVRLDLSSSGRGLQQTLLLLAYLALHPGAVLLLDEPDAHLELLRQREIFQILSESARSSGSQLIIASHSEEILNQAAETSEEGVVAFLGKPHRIPRNRTAAVRRALDEVHIDQYYLAEQKGWVLYLENRTDLSILRAFAKRLKHLAGRALEFPFLYSIGNQPNNGRRHFDALSEAWPDLEGYWLVDHDAPELRTRENLADRKWERREIENYICQPETLESFAKEYGRSAAGGPLFEQSFSEQSLQSMRKAIGDRVPPAALRDRSDPWWDNVKASDEFLDLVFPGFFHGLGLKPDFPKASYHELVRHVPEEMISAEVLAVLDEIHAVARKAHPA
ncbi:MAG: AAA family ATPase, partial [Acidobacteria bacterium]|nr:AAA family ATPase [Acidobacteriota bacterium]